MTLQVLDKRFEPFITSEAHFDKAIEQVEDMLATMVESKPSYGDYLEVLDKVLATELELSDTKPSCGTKPHCTGCCHMNVDVQPYEVRHIIEKNPHLRSGMFRYIRTHNNDARWLQRRPCFFLKEGKCSIYKDRPVECRTYYVTTSPKLCFAKKVNQKISGLVFRNVLVLTSAYRNYRALTEGLPDEEVLEEVMYRELKRMGK